MHLYISQGFCCQNLSEQEWFSTNCSALVSRELQSLSISVDRAGKVAREGRCRKQHDLLWQLSKETISSSAHLSTMSAKRLTYQFYVMLCWLPRWRPLPFPQVVFKTVSSHEPSLSLPLLSSPLLNQTLTLLSLSRIISSLSTDFEVS